jgi:drug/metabolite transporter (DMT)-like permease
MARQALSNWSAVAVLCALALTFSANHIAARHAFNHGVSVLTAVGFRSGGIALILLLLILFTGGRLSVPKLTLQQGLIVGLLVTIQSFCIYRAVALLPVGIALLVFNLFPVCFLIFNRIINKVAISARSKLVAPIIVLGLVLALNPFAQSMVGAASGVAGSSWISGNALLGLFFSLGAALSFGLALTLTERWLKAIDGRLRSLMSMAVVAAIAAMAAALNLSIPALQWRLPVDNDGWVGLISLTILYGCAFASLFALIPRLNMPRNAPVMNIEPIFALALGWSIFGQSVAPLQWLGAIIVIAGVVTLAKAS